MTKKMRCEHNVGGFVSKIQLAKLMTLCDKNDGCTRSEMLRRLIDQHYNLVLAAGPTEEIVGLVYRHLGEIGEVQRDKKRAG